jgi:molybdopterin converting factor small subunit
MFIRSWAIKEVNMQVTVRLFGTFKKYGDEAHLEFAGANQVIIADVRKVLKQWMSSRDDGSETFKLLDDSVFANDIQVLSDSMSISGAYIAVLPPVCGG